MRARANANRAAKRARLTFSAAAIIGDTNGGINIRISVSLPIDFNSGRVITLRKALLHDARA